MKKMLLILFIGLSLQTINAINASNKLDIAEEKIITLEYRLARSRDSHEWIPVLEQILPKISQLELDAMAEALRQMKQRDKDE